MIGNLVYCHTLPLIDYSEFSLLFLLLERNEFDLVVWQIPPHAPEKLDKRIDRSITISVYGFSKPKVVALEMRQVLRI